MKNKILFLTTLVLLLLLTFSTINFAGSLSSSIGSTSIDVNATTTLSVSASSATGTFSVTSSNPNIVSVGSYSTWIEDNTISITLTGKNAGTSTITVKSTGCFDSTDESPVSYEKSYTVTVTSPIQETTPDTSTDNESSSTNSSNSSSGSTTSNNSTSNTTTTSKSTNAYLSNLGLKTYDFTGFKKSKNEYYVTVPNSVNNVEVYYKAAEASQSISVSGGKNLVEGTNLIKVTVTAEAGNTNVYKIYVTKKTAEDIEETTPNVVDDSTPESLYLIALSVGNLELSPAFDKSIFEYTAELTEDLTELEVLATANSKTATITIEGNKELVNGENKITITIADETQTITYTIIVNKNVETFDIALLTSIIDNWPFDSNLFDGMSYYLNQENIFIGIVVICIIYLGIFAGYVVISEQKLISKKTNSFTKYEGSRFK